MDLRNEVGAYEAKTHFSALLEKVAQGEEIIITKHGVPVARLVPAQKKKSTPAQRKAAMDKWLSSPNRPTLGGLKIKDLIAEGRK